MKLNPEKIQRLINSVDELIARAEAAERSHAEVLAHVHPNLAASARNLIHYRALRGTDIRAVQNKLGSLGLTRLAQAQAHVMASLHASRSVLKSFLDPDLPHRQKSPVSIRKSSKLIRANSKALLGYRSKGRRARIMVTLAREAATDYEFVHELVEAGMNSARINCAHDDPVVWSGMVENVRSAATLLRRKVRICMDLGGPKIRTGPMVEGPRVVSFGPSRDGLGHVSDPAVVWLAEPDIPSQDGLTHLPVTQEWLDRVRVGDRILFRDTRDKKRRLEVVEAGEGGFWCRSYDRAFVVTGTSVFLNDWNAHPSEILTLPPTISTLVLEVGDLLILHRTPEPGEPARFDRDGRLVEPPHISCTNEEVFDHIGPGDRVLFDDGKIQGVVVEVERSERVVVQISYAKAGGQKLRADKGINLPDTNLPLPGLTAKDREDLAFVVQHADVVNMSFINAPSDVEDLMDELERLGASQKIGIVLKIETPQAFNNLTEILLTAMRTYPVGVMIARGDLAVECGWENVPRLQQEIQSLCQAAHLPDIWATQVLENMAKKGIPSRAELTDAASALRAECVMLNKGPHIVKAVRMLDSILKNMHAYRHDKAPMLPALSTESSTLDGSSKFDIVN